ncbi:NADH-quinone oxidoreductase subunit NuoK [Palleronia pontilimi]
MTLSRRTIETEPPDRMNRDLAPAWYLASAAALPAESLSLIAIVDSQREVWNVIRQPLGLPLFVIVALTIVLVAAAALIGIGVYEALSQQSLVMLMMGLELMLNGGLLAIIGFWSLSLGGMPEGQFLAVIVMAVMAVEMAVGFALVVAIYRKRQADVTESIGTLSR